jgi:lactobin A/cerein 7B family class IIb bacteriocin
MDKFKKLSFEEMQEVKGGIAPLIILGVTVSWSYIGGALGAGLILGALIAAIQHLNE